MNISHETLKFRFNRAETAEEFAEICRLETLPVCDVCEEYSDTISGCVAYGIETFACEECSKP